MQDKTLYATLGLAVLLALIASGIAPYDGATWLLKVASVLIAAPILQGAEDFLGTQGDPRDTQSDMLMALLGALFSVTWLASLQDRQIAKQAKPAPAG